MLIALGLALALPQLPASAQTAPPDPSLPNGGVPVGRLVIEAVDQARNRPVTIDVWYQATSGGDDDRIDLEYTELQTLAYSGVGFAPGPHPLVLFSHATYADRFQSFDQMEVIASYGFIVAAPRHVGHTLADEVRGTTVGFGQSMNDRLGDMAFTKALLDGPGPGQPGLLTSLIEHDADGDPRLAVMGHSLGAVTALQMSDGATEPFWGVQAAPDSDVDAVVAVAPALQFHTPDTADQTPDEDPLLMITGSDDAIVTPAIRQQLWDSWDSLRKFRVDMHGVNHTAPSSGCKILDALAVALWSDPTNAELAEAVQILSDRMDGACSGDPDRYIVNRTASAFQVPFLLRVLKGDTAYETWLARPRSNRSTLVPNDYWRCTPTAGTCDTVPS
jgi:predicted alpha/beta hydrolase family esterase